ncbi:tetratricopeptide repeat protein, partial [Actinosynnema sp. NPDC023658]|uniref:tetratricopeptide repeat protein n=1 Tax=Actinosynnema sp. NPDC023658 TaxID=3155465 RepID=UPI0033C5A346
MSADLVDRLEAQLSASTEDRAAVESLAASLARSLDESVAHRHLARLLRCTAVMAASNLVEAADALAQAMLERLPEAGEDAVRVRNQVALLAVAKGHYREAVTLLEDAHIDAGVLGSPHRATILANLAATYILAGRVDEAHKWATAAGDTADRGTAAAVLAALVGSGVARYISDRTVQADAAAALRWAVHDY